jgi:pyruvate carboxylase
MRQRRGVIHDQKAPSMSEAGAFKRVLIANRGEIALRAIRACQRLGLESVAVYSTADIASPHVWAASRAVCIGPPPARQSYLSIPSLLHVAAETGCDAVYPGYGFLSENADFARQCEESGLKFIGPSADTISTMGDKSKARETAVQYGVPVVPGSDDVFTDAVAAQPEAERIGFPLLIKARAGGGGRGMRVVEDSAGFASLRFLRRRARPRRRSAMARSIWSASFRLSAISRFRCLGTARAIRSSSSSAIAAFSAGIRNWSRNRHHLLSMKIPGKAFFRPLPSSRAV